MSRSRRRVCCLCMYCSKRDSSRFDGGSGRKMDGIWRQGISMVDGKDDDENRG